MDQKYKSSLGRSAILVLQGALVRQLVELVQEHLKMHQCKTSAGAAVDGPVIRAVGDAGLFAESYECLRPGDVHQRLGRNAGLLVLG